MDEISLSLGGRNEAGKTAVHYGSPGREKKSAEFHIREPALASRSSSSYRLRRLCGLPVRAEMDRLPAYRA
jgi:hypothetical protein